VRAASKLGEEILVDAAEHVPRGRAQPLGIEHAHHIFEDAGLEPRVILWQLSFARRKGGFDRLHRRDQGRAEIVV
jgi:hypothetical protein